MKLKQKIRNSVLTPLLALSLASPIYSQEISGSISVSQKSALRFESGYTPVTTPVTEVNSGINYRNFDGFT